MKIIRMLPHCPQGLAEYLAQGGDVTDWRRFRNEAPEAYTELRDELAELQHNLCGYCEIDLDVNDTQVEHINPQADPHLGQARALDYLNLIAACRGGTERMFGNDALDSQERYLLPIKENLSCGQAKGETIDPDFMDPRNLPVSFQLFFVRPDGDIAADNAACDFAGIHVRSVERTIAILGLKCERLRLARENRWNDLKRSWDALFDDDQAIRSAACTELLAGIDGDLPKFFTTGRSYFGSVGREILDDTPEEWI